MGLLQTNPKGTEWIAVETPFLLLALVAVALRLWARKLKRRTLEFNDYAILVAIFFIICAYVNIIIEAAIGGRGRHTADLLINDPDMLPRGAKAGFAADLLWCAAITAIKLSVLHLYNVIFCQVIFHRITYVVMGCCVVFGVVFIISTFALCPLASNWSESTTGVRCVQSTGYVVSGILNLALDVIIVALPLFPVWRLQMATIRKVAISGIFGIGLLICILTAVRLKLTFELKFDDLSYSIVTFALLSALELYLGTISACLPLLSPVISKLANSTKARSFSAAISSWGRRSTRALLSKDSRNASWTRPRFRSGGSDPSKASKTSFGRQDELGYPLIEGTGGGRPGGDKAEARFSEEKVLTALPRVKDRGVIQVTDGGTVQSEPGAYMV